MIMLFLPLWQEHADIFVNGMQEPHIPVVLLTREEISDSQILIEIDILKNYRVSETSVQWQEDDSVSVMLTLGLYLLERIQINIQCLDQVFNYLVEDIVQTPHRTHRDDPIHPAQLILYFHLIVPVIGLGHELISFFFIGFKFARFQLLIHYHFYVSVISLFVYHVFHFDEFHGDNVLLQSEAFLEVVEQIFVFHEDLSHFVRPIWCVLAKSINL